MKVGELALIVKGRLATRGRPGYEAELINMEYALMAYHQDFDDLIYDLDSECALEDLRDMAGPDWRRVLGLVALWLLQDLQREGYFMSDD